MPCRTLNHTRTRLAFAVRHGVQILPFRVRGWSVRAKEGSKLRTWCHILESLPAGPRASRSSSRPELSHASTSTTVNAAAAPVPLAKISFDHYRDWQKHDAALQYFSSSSAKSSWSPEITWFTERLQMAWWHRLNRSHNMTLPERVRVSERPTAQLELIPSTLKTMIPNNKTRRTSTRAILMQPTVAGIFLKKGGAFYFVVPDWNGSIGYCPNRS